MDRVGDVLQLVGVALVVTAAYVVSEALGLFVAGLAAVSVGVAAKRPVTKRGPDA